MADPIKLQLQLTAWEQSHTRARLEELGLKLDPETNEIDAASLEHVRGGAEAVRALLDENGELTADGLAKLTRNIEQFKHWTTPGDASISIQQTRNVRTTVLAIEGLNRALDAALEGETLTGGSLDKIGEVNKRAAHLESEMTRYLGADLRMGVVDVGAVRELVAKANRLADRAGHFVDQCSELRQASAEHSGDTAAIVASLEASQLVISQLQLAAVSIGLVNMTGHPAANLAYRLTQGCTGFEEVHDVTQKFSNAMTALAGRTALRPLDVAAGLLHSIHRHGAIQAVSELDARVEQILGDLDDAARLHPKDGPAFIDLLRTAEAAPAPAPIQTVDALDPTTFSPEAFASAEVTAKGNVARIASLHTVQGAFGTVETALVQTGPSSADVQSALFFLPPDGNEPRCLGGAALSGFVGQLDTYLDSLGDRGVSDGVRVDSIDDDRQRQAALEYVLRMAKWAQQQVPAEHAQ